MNTRVRVKAIPALLAGSLGLSSLGTIGSAVGHEGNKHGGATRLQPEGLPELTLTVEESGVTGMPETLEADRYLVKVTGPEPGKNGPSGAVFAQLPEGITAEEAFEAVVAAAGGPPSW